MQQIAEMFRGGGIWMYLILGTALLSYILALNSILFSIPAVTTGKMRESLVVIAALTVMSAAIMVVLGYAGYQTGLADMHAALEAVSPENRQEVLMKGREIANYPLTFAMWLAPLPGVCGVLGIAAYLGGSKNNDA